MSAPAHLSCPAPGHRPGAGPRRWLATRALPGPAGLALLASLLWPPAPAWAHGVSTSFQQAPATVATTIYDGGEPMSFGKVRVLGPKGQTYQVGNADAQGRFAWLPDGPGHWKVIMEDGMGHRAEAQVETGPSAASGAAYGGPATPLASGQGWRPDRASAVAWGLALIFWLWGLLLWRAGRRRAGPK